MWTEWVYMATAMAKDAGSAKRLGQHLTTPGLRKASLAHGIPQKPGSQSTPLDFYSMDLNYPPL